MDCNSIKMSRLLTVICWLLLSAVSCQAHKPEDPASGRVAGQGKGQRIPNLNKIRGPMSLLCKVEHLKKDGTVIHSKPYNQEFSMCKTGQCSITLTDELPYGKVVSFFCDDEDENGNLLLEQFACKVVKDEVVTKDECGTLLHGTPEGQQLYLPSKSIPPP